MAKLQKGGVQGVEVCALLRDATWQRIKSSRKETDHYNIWYKDRKLWKMWQGKKTHAEIHVHDTYIRSFLPPVLLQLTMLPLFHNYVFR
jgi:hypothetical protein